MEFALNNHLVKNECVDADCHFDGTHAQFNVLDKTVRKVCV